MNEEKILGIILRAKADIDAAVDELKSGMKDTEKQAKESAKKISKEYEDAFGKIQKAGAIAFAAISAVAAKTIYDATKEAETYHRLATSIELTGVSYESVKKRVEDYTASMQASTRFADDEMAASMQQIITLTGNVEKGFEGSKLAADIASSGMWELNEASRYVAMAMSGELTMLGRYIPALKETALEQAGITTQSEKAAYALEVLREKFGGSAQKDLESFAGALDQMKNYIENASEAIGNALIPAIIPLLKHLTDGAKFLKEFADEYPDVIKYSISMALAVTSLVFSLGTIGVAVSKALTAIEILEKVLKALELQILAVKIAILSIPGWGWAIGAAVAVGALAASFFLVGDKAEKAYPKIENMAEAVRNVESAASDATKVVSEWGHITEEELAEATKNAVTAIVWLDDSGKPIPDTLNKSAKAAETTEDSFEKLEVIIDRLGIITIPQLIKKRDDIEFLLTNTAARALLTKDTIAELEDQLISLTAKINDIPIEKSKNDFEELTAIINKLGIITIPQLIEKRDDIEFLLTNTAARALLTKDAIAELEDQLISLARTIADIPPEEKLKPRPKPKISDEKAAENAAIEIARRRTELENQLIEKGIDAHVAAEIAKTAITQDQALKRVETYQREQEIQKQFLDGLIAGIKNITSSIFDFSSVFYENQIISIEKTRDAENKRWDEYSERMRAAGQTESNEYKRRQKEHERALASYEKQEASVRRKAFEADKKGRMASTVMLTAEAVIRALASVPPPFGQILAAIAAVTGAAQLAIISAQKNPYHAGGFVRGAGINDEVLIIARAGEMVINQESTARYRALLEEINAGRSNIRTMPIEYIYANQVAQKSAGMIPVGGVAGYSSLNSGKQLVFNQTLNFNRETSKKDAYNTKRIFDSWVVEAVIAAYERGAFKNIFKQA